MAENQELVVAGEAEDAEKELPAKSFMPSADIMRQIIIVVALAVCLAVVVYLIFLAKAPEIRPLGQYDSEELVKVLDLLDANKIEYELDNTRTGGTVYVSTDDYQKILLLLNKAGAAISGKTTGDELILKDSGFGVSQRLEAERLKLSREQQLAKLIEENQKISKATVLLAIPKDNVFARDKRKPSATVMVNVKGGTILTQENVDSIVNTVASAVHDLEPSRVTVTDQNGRLLNSGSQDLATMASRKEFELQQKKEAEYKQKIDSILIPVLGLGNFTAEVDVTMDFSTEEKTSKTFNPDGSSVRSEVTRENINGSTVSGGIPGSLSNQPPASSQIPETIKNDNNTGTVVSGSSVGNMSKEATRNYELDTVITHKQKGYGGISKLSVSVAVNYLEQTVDGKLQQTPRNDADLDKIRKLLEGGLGIDATRGDALEVVSVPFNRVQSLDELPEEPIYEQEWFWRGFKILASVILVIVIVLVVIKPMVEKLLADKKKEDHDTGAEDLDDQVALDGDDDLHLIAQSVEGSNGESVYNVKNGQVILPDIHKDEDVLRAVRALVANEPDLAAKVVKEWLEGENTK